MPHLNINTWVIRSCYVAVAVAGALLAGRRTADGIATSGAHEGRSSGTQDGTHAYKLTPSASGKQRIRGAQFQHGVIYNLHFLSPSPSLRTFVRPSVRS